MVGVYSFITHIFQTLSPLLFGFCANLFKVKTRPFLYGPLIGGFVIFGYLMSAIFYWRAGKKFKNYVEEK